VEISFACLPLHSITERIQVKFALRKYRELDAFRGLYFMKYSIFIAITGLTFFVGCATNRAPSSQERIAAVGNTYEETDKRLIQAEKELTSFENSVANLRQSAASEENMRSKSGFDEAMANLKNRIQQTRFDLQELKTANDRGRTAYNRQLEEAAANIQNSAAE
jgi:hypothetical protein